MDSHVEDVLKEKGAARTSLTELATSIAENDDDDGVVLAEEIAPREGKREFYPLKAEDVLVRGDARPVSPSSPKTRVSHHVLLDDHDGETYKERVSGRLEDWGPLELEVGRRVDEGQVTTRMEVHEENLEWDELDGRGELIDDEPVLNEMIISMPTCLYTRLYKHQRQGVRFMWTLYRSHLGGLIADEMGLGKTIQIIAFVAALFYSGELARQSLTLDETETETETWAESLWSHPNKPILIICPTTLLPQWVTEFNEFFPLIRVKVIHRDATRRLQHITHPQSRRHIQTHGGVFLTSFETLRSHLNYFEKIEWFYGIIDEGQKIRNPDALITLAVKKLRLENRLLLSGSPIQNDLKEFWSLFDFVQPGKLGTLPVFNEHFGEPIMKSGLSSYAAERGQQAAGILKTLVNPHMIRRTKIELISNSVSSDSLGLDLPTKDEQVILCPLSLSQYQIYVDFLVTHHVQAEVSKSLLQPKLRRRARHGVEEIHQKSLWYISVLSKICNHPDLLLLHMPSDQWPADFGTVPRSGKLKVLMGILDAWRLNKKKALIFSQTNQVLDIIQHAVEREKYKFLRLDGRTPIPNRLQMVQEFNASNDLHFMLLTTRVGGLGLNLTGAARVIIFDPDWNPTVDSQAQERAWRIGQGENVIVYRLLSQGTLEQKIYKRQLYKHFLAQKVLTNQSQNQLFRAQDFMELFSYPPAPKELESFEGGEDVGLTDRLRRLLMKAYSRQKNREVPLDVGVELKARRELNVLPTQTPTSQSSISEAGEISEHESADEDEDESGEIEEGQGRDEAGLLGVIFNSNQVAGVLDHKAAIRESNNLLSSNSNASTQSALQAIRLSQANRAAYGSHVPTWTGRSGIAGRPIALASETHHAAMWSFKELETKLDSNSALWDSTWKTANPTERRLIESVCAFFGKNTGQVSTGEILTHFGPMIATDKQKLFFRDVLKRLCDQEKGTPTRWQLKTEAAALLNKKKRDIDPELFDLAPVKKPKRKMDSDEEWA